MEQLNLFRKIRGQQEMSWATIVDFYARLREPAEIIGSLHDKFLGGPGLSDDDDEASFVDDEDGDPN
ncbi:hypothetical protein TNCV_3428881 [Trichonephila clavipes]|nr:hypothetical protein TNCV_3428881 [Trichonephila clavipes]